MLYIPLLYLKVVRRNNLDLLKEKGFDFGSYVGQQSTKRVQNSRLEYTLCDKAYEIEKKISDAASIITAAHTVLASDHSKVKINSLRTELL